MRTTIRLHPEIKRQATKLAADTGRSFTQVVEQALVRLLAEERKIAAGAKRPAVVLPSADLGPYRVPVELINRTSELMDLMEEDDFDAAVARWVSEHQAEISEEAGVKRAAS